MKVVASINARMGSTRLPGKVLMDIGGVPLLTRIVNRLRRCTTLDGIILATTNKPEDDVLRDWADKTDIVWFAGSENDVLNRTVKAHRMMNSEIVVRVCGDTPLIDPVMIDVAVDMVREGDCDIAMATADRIYPHGTTAHVCKYDDLRKLDNTLTDPVLREHVTLHLYESGEYRVNELQGLPQWECRGQRLQVDYPEDLKVVRLIQERLGPDDDFGIGDIVKLLKREPWIRGLNALCEETVVR